MSEKPLPAQPGRNFLEVVKGIQGYNRERAMQPGDYIEMPWKNFRQWSATQPNGEKEDKSTLPIEGDIEVSVVEIVRAEGEPTQIVVGAGGRRRKIDASLFFNYGHDHGERKEKVILSASSFWDERNAG